MTIKRGIILCAAAILLTLNFACREDAPDTSNAENTSSNAAKPLSALETDVQTLRTANLKYIFIFRRTDGGTFDGEDKKYLRTNLPTTNRVLLTDDGKAFVVGSNYSFPPENMEVLRVRFNVEDQSGEK